MRTRNGPVVARSVNNEEDRSSTGVAYVMVQVANLAKQGAPYVAEFLVDTGSIDCMAPADVLEAAGIVREGKKVYELADGRPVEFDYGFARVSFLGDETVAQVVFGPPDTEPLLGGRCIGERWRRSGPGYSRAKTNACAPAQASTGRLNEMSARAGYSNG
jgi:predicted aspartyl protease